MGKHKTKRKSRKHTIKKGGRDPPDIGLLKSELARQKEETAYNIEHLTNENERLDRDNERLDRDSARLDRDSARLEIEKRDLEGRNLVLVNELNASTDGRELCLSQITTLRRENAEVLSANEFLNEENDNLLDELQELKKKKIED